MGPMVKLGGLVTVNEIDVVTGVSVPEVPVMVIGYVPARVVAATVKVTTLEVVEEAGLNDAVTPVGKPDAANVTLPVNVQDRQVDFSLTGVPSDRSSSLG